MHCSKTLVVASISSILFLSCSESSAPIAGSPAALVIVGGNNQVGPVGAELPIPLVAQVVDSAGNPVKGQIVNFIVISGGGSVFAGAALSNDSGIVREHWTLGTSTTGAQEVDARALDPDNGQQIGNAVFTALAIAGPPTYFATVAGDSQRALMGDQLPESLAVILRDQYGNNVSDFTVTWTVLSGGGSITPSSLTDAAGIAKAAWRMGNVGGAAEVGVTVGAVQPMLFHAEALVPLTAVAVSSGFHHSCAITTAGQGYCWGANDAGQLGLAKTTVLEQCPLGSVCSSRALLLTSPLTWNGIEAGSGHSCGVVSGSAYCWGDNHLGELGIGSIGGDGFPPTAVAGALSFAMVRTGAGYSCGLSSTGTASCWGDNQVGQLGTGLDTIADQPTSVAGGITFGTVATTGYGSNAAFTCGLAVDSTAYCWGNNLYGQLGDSLLENSATTPQRVAGGLRFTAIAVGGSHACALTSSGAVYCWGTYASLDVPPSLCAVNNACSFPVPVNGAPSLVQISAGLDFTCGVTIDGAGYCWGGGGIVTAVPGGLQFSQIKAGFFHACGVTKSSAVYCWGNNEEGQLGDGTFQSRVTPVRVIVQ